MDLPKNIEANKNTIDLNQPFLTIPNVFTIDERNLIITIACVYPGTLRPTTIDSKQPLLRIEFLVF